MSQQQQRKGQVVIVEDKDEIKIKGITRFYFYVLLLANIFFILVFYTGLFEWGFGRFYTLDVIIVVSLAITNAIGIFMFKALGR